MKKNWLEKIVEALKFISCVFVMTMGFWIIYTIAWFAIGLPETNWAMWLLFALAMLSEFLYVKWISN